MFDEMLKFVSYLSSKGLLNSNTAGVWSRATEAVKKVLEGEEVSIEQLEKDIDTIFQRYSNKYSNLSPQSLKAYRGAFRSLLKEFRLWQQDKLNYKPSFTPRRARTSLRSKVKQESEQTITARTIEPAATPSGTEISKDVYKTMIIPFEGGRKIELKFPADVTDDEITLFKAMLDVYFKNVKSESK